MPGLSNTGIVSAPPSVVITPKVETAAIKSEDEMQEKKQANTNLSRFLEYLLKLLQKKDSNSFFAVPVNDQFAPGYSQIIKTPMDFSTMRSKVNHIKILLVIFIINNPVTQDEQDINSIASLILII